MAKITRKDQKVFGESAGATGITEYGSPAAGLPVYSTDPDDIQTTEWETGWAAAALAGGEIPTFQDFNGIHNVQTRQLAYIFQEGIPEYSAGTEYHEFSIVKKTGSYEIYGSIIDDNLGNALPNAVDDANWKYLGDLSNLVNASSFVLQHEYDEVSSVVSGSTNTPFDNTSPSIGEGNSSGLSINMTANDAANKMRISGVLHLASAASNDDYTVSVFQGSTCIGVSTTFGGQSIGDQPAEVSFDFEIVAGSVTAQTYTVNFGGNQSSTLTLNGTGGTGLFDGKLKSTLTIEEISS